MFLFAISRAAMRHMPLVLTSLAIVLLPCAPGIDEPIAADGAVLLLALRIRSEAVGLTLGRLADPARGTKATEVL